VITKRAYRGIQPADLVVSFLGQPDGWPEVGCFEVCQMHVLSIGLGELLKLPYRYSVHAVLRGAIAGEILEVENR
jgi:hypothetical protein